MKESVGIVGIFQIVILFILLFTGIMCLTLNHANTFAIKNDVVNTIVFLNGNITDEVGNLKPDLVNILKDSSYRNTGKCDAGFIGYDQEGKHGVSKPVICIKEVNVVRDRARRYGHYFHDRVGKDDYVVGKSFKVEVFYQLNLPVFRDLFNIKTIGETKIIYGGAL